MDYTGFVGSTDTLRSPNINAERTINWYYEPGAPGTPKTNAWLSPTPGLTPYVILPESPVRALFHEDGRGFAVGGGTFNEISATAQNSFRGNIAADGLPATISSNGSAGHQLFITSAGLGYIYNLAANTITPIADPGLILPTAMGAFIDGFFLSLVKNSRTFQISDLEDGTVWDPTDVFEVSESSDNIVAMVANHRELWLLGSRTTEIWANLGDPLNPFQPIPGAFLQQGIIGPFAWTVADNTLYWVTQNAQGAKTVVRASGYSPERVSSFAIEFRLSQYENLDQLVLWSYQENGHQFIVLWPPNPGDQRSLGFDGSVSFVFDASTGQWHERAVWDSTDLVWVPHRGRCAAYGFGKILVGDRSSPAVYSMSLDLQIETLVTVA